MLMIMKNRQAFMSKLFFRIGEADGNSIKSKKSFIAIVLTISILISIISALAYRVYAQAIEINELSTAAIIAQSEFDNTLQEKETDIEKLEKELELSQAKITQKETHIETLNTDIELLNEEFESLNADLEAIKKDMFDSEHVYGTIVTSKEVNMLAKTVYGEANGLSKIEQSLVIWCILNRVDAGQGSIAKVITAPNQFIGYKESHPVTNDIKELVKDVLARWQMEKVCDGAVGRTLPKEYLYFSGDGRHNWYRNKFSGNYKTWDWNKCWNPYK